MNLTELALAVEELAADAHMNRLSTDDVEIHAITDRGTIRPIRGFRHYDHRTEGPILLLAVKPTRTSSRGKGD